MVYNFTKSILFTFVLICCNISYSRAQGDITFIYYFDANCDGNYDTGEPIAPIDPPVLFDVLTSTPYGTPPVGNTFVGVPAGDYELQWPSVWGDWVLHDPISGITTINGHGATNQTFYAAYYQYGSLTTFVWEDMDGNGIQDGGEPGITGATVTLTGTSCLGNAINMTGNDIGGGLYEFLDVEPSNGSNYTLTYTLPTSYEPTDQMTGTTNGSDINASGIISNVSIGNNEDVTEYDAGYFQFSTISDFVWEDLNGDGVQGGEPGIAGVTVNLTGNDGAGNAVNLTDVTDGSGNYSFTTIPPGSNYTITFNEPSTNHFITGQDKGGDDNMDSDPDPTTGIVSGVVVVSNDLVDHIDCGMYRGVDIGDFVWEDVDGDGQQDGGEPGFAGVTVSLIGTDGAGDPVTRPNIVTPASGAYLFTDLPPGSYTIKFGPALPANTYFTDPDQGADGTDSDADKVTGDAPVVIILSGDPNILDIDAGVFLGATISNFVWEDTNGNGFQDSGEPGLDGVPIIIETSTGGAVTFADGTGAVPITSATGGMYMFDKLKPGMYRLVFGPFAPYFRTITGAGTAATDSDPDQITGITPTVTVISDEMDNTIDAGFFEGCRVADFTWLDLNGNGLQDGGEAGLAGVTITLTTNLGGPVTDANNLAVVPVVSGGAGDYEFIDLKPGSYRVTFAAPGGFFPTRLNAAGGPGDAADATNDSDCDQSMGNQSHIFNLDSGENQVNIDAGFYEPVSIGDMVWHDADADGVFDAGEDGVAGVTVQIANADGSPLTNVNNVAVAPQSTDAAGMYEFMDLRPGLYRLTVVPPAMWFFSVPDIGGEATDSDFNPGNGVITTDVQINSNATNIDIDAGIYKNINLCGTIWGDNNNNNMLDAAPTDGFFPGVTVQLTGTAGDGTAQNLSVTSNATGVYCFAVKPGDYIISIPSTMFGTGAPLNGLESCPGQNDPENNVDNDDNGDGDGPTTTSTVMVRCGEEPEDMGVTNTTIDFCFKFDCSEPNPLAALSCDMVTDTFCNLSILNGFCARMPNGPAVPPFPDPLCPGGGFVANNMSWFAFIAGDNSTPYSITVTPFNCVPAQPGGQPDVQMGIYTDCNFNNAIYCNGNCNGSPTPETIPSTGLIPGNTYYFFLDGCSGTVCSYTVDVSGFVEYIIPEPATIECMANNGPCSPICPNNTVTLTVNPAAPDSYNDAVLKFVWRVTEPGGNVITVNTTENKIENFLLDKLGTYKFEIISVSNKCNGTSTVISYEILVRHPENEVFTPISLCEKYIPTGVGTALSTQDPNLDTYFGWGSPTFPFVGGPPPGALNTLNFVGLPGTAQQGCMYTQTVRVIELLDPPTANLNLVLCREELPYVVSSSFPFPISSNVDNLLVNLPDMASNGCDSSVLINAVVLESQFGEIANLGCQNGKTRFILQNETIPQSPPGFGPVSVVYRWRRADTGLLVNDGNPDGNPKTILLSIPGEYICEIVITMDGKTCVTEIPFLFEPLNELPSPTPLNWNTNICSSTLSSTFTAQSSEPNPTWIWTYPAGVSVTGQNSNVLNITWNNIPGGEVCVSIKDNCGESVPVCDTVVITPVPIARFKMDDIICIDSVAIASFNGTPKYPTANYNWSLSGGSIVGIPGTNGKDTIAINWASGGKKYVTLTVVNPGPLGLQCPSIPYRDSVRVDSNQIAPLIECNTSATSLIFTWPPFPGQIKAPIVNVLSGPTGVQSGDMYSITGLVPGITASVEVLFDNGHACGIVKSLAECTTQNCTPENVTFDPIPPLCLTPSNPILDLKTFVTTSATTNGTFTFTCPSSPAAITNAQLGLFDPNISGIGTHQVRVIYKDLLGCVSQAQFQNVVVRLIPNSQFDVDPVICQDSLATVTYTGNAGDLGSYGWNFGPNVTQSGANAGPFEVGWSTVGNQDVTLTVSLLGCTSQPTTKTVRVEPRIEPISITCPTIGATNLTFSWNNVSNISGYKLTLNNNPIATPPTNQLVLTGLPTKEDYTLIVEALSSTACPGKSDTLTCSTDDCPRLFVKFSLGDTILCNVPGTPNLNIAATLIGGLQSPNQKITWSGPGVTQNSADDKIGIFNPNIAGVGVHTIKMSLVDGTCTKDTTMKITIIDRPSSTFTGPSKHCITDPYIIQFSGTQNLPLDWKLPTGVSISPATGMPNKYRVIFPSAGVYTIGLVVGNASCQSSQTNITVTVDPELIAPTITCSQTTTSITFNWNDIECATQYKVFVNGMDKGTQSTLTYAVNNLMVGDQATIVVSPISTCACPPKTDTLTCTAKDCPQINVIATNPKPSFCFGSETSPIQLSASVAQSNGTGSGSWSGPNCTPSGSINIIGLVPGTYTYTYNFTEENCNFSDKVDLIVHALPSLTLSTTDPTCISSNFGSVTSTVTGGLQPYTYKIDDIAANIPFGLQAPGSHAFLVSDANGCTSTGSFIINSAPTPSLALTASSQNVLVGQTVSLKATFVGLQGGIVDSIVWRDGSGNIVCKGNLATCSEITLNAVADEIYTATVYFNGDCQIGEQIEIKVKKVVIIEFPNIINLSNPNNSTFYVANYETVAKVKEMNIYDRWGNLIFSALDIPAGDPSQGWNGKFNNKNVSSGVYVYKIALELLDGKIENYKGDLTIIE
jgi:gliding motility-associated-like protein